MKGILHKKETGWVVNYPQRKTTPGNPKSLGSYKRTSLRSEIPVHPDYVKYYFLDEDAEGGEVEFEIVRYCKVHKSEPSKNCRCTIDCAYDEVRYAKLIKPKKINLEEMPKEEWEEARNPAYKHFDIDTEYPELNTISLQPQPNSISFFIKNEPIIVIDEVGFKYKGELIEDSGEIYKLFKEFLTRQT